MILPAPVKSASWPLHQSPRNLFNLSRVPHRRHLCADRALSLEKRRHRNKQFHCFIGLRGQRLFILRQSDEVTDIVGRTQGAGPIFTAEGCRLIRVSLSRHVTCPLYVALCYCCCVETRLHRPFTFAPPDGAAPSASARCRLRRTQ